MKKRTEKERKRRVYSAFMLLLISIIAITTATYAWFTQSTAVELAGFDIYVEATSGIQVSMDGYNWHGSLTLEQIRGEAFVGSTNQIPNILRPVSTGGTISSGQMDMFLGIVERVSQVPILTTSRLPNEVGGPGNTASDEGYYAAFDLFIRATEAGTLMLGVDSAVTFKQIDESDPRDVDRGLKNSARVAFIRQGSGTYPEVLGAQLPATGSAPAIGGPVVFWEPNNNEHTDYAIAYARNILRIGNIAPDEIIPEYLGVKANIGIEDRVPLDNALMRSHPQSSNFFNSIVPQISTNAPRVEYPQSIFPIPAGITKLRIYAWIEGQDMDCEDEASGTNLTFTINFSI